MSGRNDQGQLGVSGLGNPHSGTEGWMEQSFKWLVLSAGPRNACGVLWDTTLWCWGSNDAGQMGTGNVGPDQLVPIQVGPSGWDQWQQVAVGFDHVCGIRSGELWCWGTDLNGQLGNGAGSSSLPQSPRRVGTGTDWVAIAAGGAHSCAIRQDTKVYCWGKNSSGQAGVGSFVDVQSPVAIDSGYTAVDAGKDHSCGMRGDDVYCWGSNSNGQLGVTQVGVGGTLTAPQYAVDASGVPHGWVSFSTGDDYTCALQKQDPAVAHDTRYLYCWGNADHGQIDLSVSSNEPTPVQTSIDFDCDITPPFSSCVVTADAFSSVSAGSDHLCAIHTEITNVLLVNNVPFNTLYQNARGVKCLGENQYNQHGVVAQASLSLLAGYNVLGVSAGSGYTAMLVDKN